MHYIKKYNINFNNGSKALAWGTYRISNDTIIAQYLYATGATSLCGSIFFKIIVSCSIQRINPVDRSNNIINEILDYRPLYYYKFSYSVAHFVPYKNIPNTERSAVIQKKWFWCNETDWRNFMDEERKKQKPKKK